MRQRIWGILAIVLLAAGVVAVVARWRAQQAHPLDIGIGLLVLIGVPAVLWLVPRVPGRRTPRQLPSVFWVGLSMILVGAGFLALGLTPVGKTTITAKSGIGYRVSTNPSPAVNELKSPPIGAVKALQRVLPGTHIAFAFSSDAAYPTELLIAKGPRLVAEAHWSSGVLTFLNLGWDAYLNGNPPPKPRYSWNELKHVVDLPPHTKILGPYRLPGYDVMVVPSLGQVWDINVTTGQPEGNGV